MATVRRVSGERTHKNGKQKKKQKSRTGSCRFSHLSLSLCLSLFLSLFPLLISRYHVISCVADSKQSKVQGKQLKNTDELLTVEKEALMLELAFAVAGLEAGITGTPQDMIFRPFSFFIQTCRFFFLVLHL